MIRHVVFQFEAFNLRRERERYRRYCREGWRRGRGGREKDN